MDRKKRIISILVKNHAGVLARVSLLFCQRGFNIDSLTVSATDDPEISRITVTTSGDDAAMRQVISQTQKLTETTAVFELEKSNSVMRELLLVKVEAAESERSKVREISEIYKAKIVDLSPDSMILELTGKPEKIDGMIGMLSEFNISEMCRTGVTALSRGIQKQEDF